MTPHNGDAFSNAPRTIKYPNPTKHESELGPQLPCVPPKSSRKREKNPLGLRGNPVTFLLKKYRIQQKPAKLTWLLPFVEPRAGRSSSGFAPVPHQQDLWGEAAPASAWKRKDGKRQAKPMSFSSEENWQNTVLIYSRQLSLKMSLRKVMTPLQLHRERNF